MFRIGKKDSALFGEPGAQETLTAKRNDSNKGNHISSASVVYNSSGLCFHIEFEK